MGRIIFLNPFAKTEISGGIKTAHRHAELLAEMGFDACVYQPEGPPSWFDSRAKLVSNLTATAGDVLVFPETINGPLVEIARSRSPAKKVLFCQAQYYALFNAIPPDEYRQLGFARVACQSAIAKGFVERVLHFSDVAVIPCYVDTDLFFPREKALQIALIPKKLPREAAAIHSVFGLKYPELRAVPWAVIENRAEREVAQTFGRSAIVLSLPFLESFGLVPLEAMASGAIVVGFHGHGALEYASPENGLWFSSDQIEKTADALARVLTGLKTSDPAFGKMREAGKATAERYNKEATRDALRAFYGSIMM